jgi:hypothetical protein
VTCTIGAGLTFLQAEDDITRSFISANTPVGYTLFKAGTKAPTPPTDAAVTPISAYSATEIKFAFYGCQLGASLVHGQDVWTVPPSTLYIIAVVLFHPPDPSAVVLAQPGILKEDLSHIARRQSLIPPTWVLFDSASSIHIFRNRHLLRNIREVEDTMMVHTNNNCNGTNLMGEFPGFNDVWFDENGIANVLSMKLTQDAGYLVDYSTLRGRYFTVTHPETHEQVVFVESPTGLYYNDISQSSPSLLLNMLNGVSPDKVVTVADKIKNYSKADYMRALAARRLQVTLNRPSTRDLISYLNHNQIPHTTVTSHDVMAAEDIFGPDEGSLRGKTTRTKTGNVPIVRSPVPEDFLSRYRTVTLCMDVMFVNTIPFLMTISEHLCFGTATDIPDRKPTTFLDALKPVLALYHGRGFLVTMIRADTEFETLRTSLRNTCSIELNIAPEGEHVPQLDRYIRTIKERCRCNVASVPWAYWPRLLVVLLVGAATFWINVFPPGDALSRHISPRTMLTGLSLDARKHCRVPFGSYVHTHEEGDNTMAARTLPAIAGLPTGNAQGTHTFFNLTTGRALQRNHWTELPMPHHVIAQLNRMGRKNRNVPGVHFRDRYPDDDIDDPDDASYDPEHDNTNHSSTSSDDLDAVPPPHPLPPAGPGVPIADWITVGTSTAGVAPTHTVTPAPAVPPGRYDAIAPADVDTAAGDESDGDNHADASDNADDANGDDNAPPQDMEEDEAPHEETHNENVTNSEQNDTDTPRQEHRSEDADHLPAEENRSVRSANQSPHQENRSGDNNDDNGMVNEAVTNGVKVNEMEPGRLKKEYQKLMGIDNIVEPVLTRSLRSGTILAQTHQRLEKAESPPHSNEYLIIKPDEWMNEYGQSFPWLEQFCCTQYGMKKGLKIFGDRGMEAIRKEMQQFEDVDAAEPVSPQNLTPEQRNKVLEYLMFLKEKRDGRIKGRGCADGRPQRLWTAREDSRSPTAHIESVFICAAIAAHERRHTVTLDIPGAFLQTEQDEEIHVRLRDEMAQLLAKINPSKYEKHMVIEHGKPVIYAKLKKALYGTLRAALLFWQKLSAALESWGFDINPYDPCVANKIINGKQCTIVWHVDDLFMSHESYDVLTDVINQIDSEFGEGSSLGYPLTVNREKTHDYLGMLLDFSEDGKVKINMQRYVKDILSDMPEFFIGTATTPATNNLFVIRKDATKLDKPHLEFFHTLTAKLLFLTQRGRPDIQLAISYLCTRVSCADEDDMKKLRRVIQYLRSTPDLVLSLEATNLNVFKWWVDASFAVHGDYRGHTGATGSLGKGSIISMSGKQKINTKSSTEAELVGVDEAMARIIWTRYFLMAQGYDADESIIYQDNKSAMLLANNGMMSSSKRTRHINVRYYFVHDRINNKEVRIEHCNTTNMVADFFTKPLQGHLFYKLRAEIMNLPMLVNKPTPSDDDEALQECVRASEVIIPIASVVDGDQQPYNHSIDKI